VQLFLDANVLFSAVHTPEGGARELFRLCEAGHCILMTSHHAILESRRNLALKSPSALDDLDRLLETTAQVPEAGPGLVAWASSLGLPENDAPVLAAAAAARAELLVTGDRRNFGHLYGSVVGRVGIVTIVEALAEVVGS